MPLVNDQVSQLTRSCVNQTFKFKRFLYTYLDLVLHESQLPQQRPGKAEQISANKNAAKIWNIKD